MTVQTAIAPLLDSALGDAARLKFVRKSTGAFRAVDYAGFDVVSLVALVGVLAVVVAVLGGRIAAMSTPDEGEEHAPRPPWRSVAWGLVQSSWQELRLLSSHGWIVSVAGVGGTAYILLQMLRNGLAFVRYICWAVVSFAGLEGGFLGHFLEFVYYTEGGLAMLGGCGLGAVCLAGLAWALTRADATSPTAAPLAPDVDRARKLTALLRVTQSEYEIQTSDLSKAFPERASQMRAIFGSLASFKAPSWAYYEADIHFALLRHLRDDDFKVESEVWRTDEATGRRRRIDLVIEGLVALEIKFWPKNSEVDRSVGQVEHYTKLWHEGLVVLYIRGAKDNSLNEWEQRATKWNADLSEHKAPVVVVAGDR